MGRGGGLPGEERGKKGRGREREVEREQERMKPTHLEERRQKESMTAQHNEIWESVWLSIHLKRLLT